MASLYLQNQNVAPKTYSIGTFREPQLYANLGDGSVCLVRWIEAIASVCWSRTAVAGVPAVDCLRSDVPLPDSTLDALEKRVVEMADEARAEDRADDFFPEGM